MDRQNQDLQSAVLRDDLQAVKGLLQQGTDVNQLAPNGNTALHMAAQRGKKDIAKFLVKHGGDVEKENVDGKTPLHLAASYGHLKETKMLLSHGGNVYKEDNTGYSALLNSVRNGHKDVVRYFLSQGTSVNKVNSKGWTPLYIAGGYGKIDMLKYLISEGADIHGTQENNLLPLANASSFGHVEVVKYLVNKGADVNKVDNNGRSALRGSAFNGHLEVAKYLISQGAEVKRGDNEGWTPLHVAAKGGHMDTCEYLISQGAEVNKGGKEGWTPLHDAAQNGHLNVTKYLISQGADVHRVDDNGRTVLRGSALNGHIEVAKYLISQGAEVNKGDNEGWTPLNLAAQEGHLNACEYLISQGAELNKGKKNGWTPLHSAAQNGHLNVTGYLVSKGADVNKVDNQGYVALRESAFNGHLEVIRYLISQGAEVNKVENEGWTPLHLAAQEGHLDTCEYLISHGAEVNKGKHNGWTALYSAAQNGHLNVTEYLVSKGADVNRVDDNGRSALRTSSFNGHIEVAKYLISQGAEVKMGDNEGWTPLHVAAYGGHMDTCEYLISQGAEVNKGNNERWTPLHLAAQEGHLDTCEYLISQGAEVNKEMNDGGTALHSAAIKGHLDVTRYLISQGAEVNKGKNNGLNPLHSAAKNGRIDVTRYLINQGADVNKADDRGGSALHYAAKEGHLDTCDYLISQGAEVGMGDNGGWTLCSAALNGHQFITKYLINQGAKVNDRYSNGRTALHIAAQNDHLEVTKCLIGYEADVNTTDNQGWTPLHAAAEGGHFDTCDYLIGQGAEVSNADDNGSTALHLAVERDHIRITKHLIHHGARVNKENNLGYTPLHIAINHGCFELVQVLLSGGAYCFSDDRDDQTALHYALTLGFKGITDLLIADLNSKNNLPILHIAVLSGDASLVEKLISYGYDINIQSTDGQTCLHKAIKLCYMIERTVKETDTLKKISNEYYNGVLPSEKALVFYLLDNGARLDIRDDAGNIPIHYAKDPVINQMILLRSPIEDIEYSGDAAPYRGNISVEVESTIDREIDLEDHGVSIFIPPGAIRHDYTGLITLTLLREPPIVNLQEDESVACYGIRCDPPHMIFQHPAKIRIPHCSVVINPDCVNPDIVSRVWDSVKDLPVTSRRRTSNSSDEPPYCKVYKRHLELFVSQCADWWVLIPLEQHVIRQKLLCSPYIPDSIERGQDVDIHLHLYANLPGMEEEIQRQEEKRLYRKVHPSVPINIATKSSDVSVVSFRDDGNESRRVLLLRDIQSELKHMIVLPMTSRDEDQDFPVTIMITQSGKIDISISLAFVIRCSGEPGTEHLLQPSSFAPVADEVSRSVLQDIDAQSIADKMTVNQYYDLGVALGFRVQQLDVMEYNRFRDREQAFYDMLKKWRQTQPSGQEAKGNLLSLMKSLESSTKDLELDISTVGEISDKFLVEFSRKIKGNKFFVIGERLGLTKRELEHIQHKTFFNRRDANIQMLSKWKASQTSEDEAVQTLKRVWESVQSARTLKNEEDEDVSHQPKRVHVKRTRSEETRSEPEIFEWIFNIGVDDSSSIRSETQNSEYLQNLLLHGGQPEEEEIRIIALQVTSLPLVRDLGKALRVGDDILVGLIDLSSPSLIRDATLQVIDSWLGNLKEEEREENLTQLLSEYNILNAKTGRKEISKILQSTGQLLQLCQRIDVKASILLEIISGVVTFPAHVIRRIALKMLIEWLIQGGTRERLLEVAQAFRFNDAALKIAEAMGSNFPPFITYGIVDQRGVKLFLDKFGITVTIPEGAIPKGMRSVATLQVRTQDSPRIPIQQGEVLITPVIETSLTQELIKPATVVVQICINPNVRRDDSPALLYTKTGPGFFGFRSLTNPTSKISRNEITFHTRHLQVFALSSNNLQGLQLTCAIFQPVIMDPTQNPTLRIYILHPYMNYVQDIVRRERCSPVAYSQVMEELNFSIHSTTRDIRIVCCIGTSTFKTMIPIKGILCEKVSHVDFELQFTPKEKGKKKIEMTIQEGSIIYAESKFETSIEDVPDYTRDLEHSHCNLQYVPDSILTILAEEIQSPKELKSLAYQLGFSPSATKKYLKQPKLSMEMLRDWRRRVRPSQQIVELHAALKNAGLGQTAEIFLPELITTSRVHFSHTRQLWESKK